MSFRCCLIIPTRGAGFRASAKVRGIRAATSIGCAALVAGGAAKLRAITLGEIGVRSEARGECDFQDGLIGLAQEFARALQAQAHVIATRRHVEMFKEQPLDLAHGEFDRFGKFARGQRILEIIGHQFHDFAQFFRAA